MSLLAKQFPFEFEATKAVSFYPQVPKNFTADILEIGPGRGDFLALYSKEKPTDSLVAIELGKKRFLKLIERVQKKEINNTYLICGDARLVLPQNFKEETFKQIYVLFPDPWPKNKHAFRRLLKVEFLTLLTHFLKPQGELIVGTDVEEYATWTVENTKKILELKNLGNPFLENSPLPEPTYFEKKWRDMGKSIYFMKFRKHAI